MKDLSQNDPLYGSARALIPSSVYSVGESGEFNLQPGSSSSVMTMTNFAGGDESGGGDCEQCEDALDNCLEDKGDLVDSLNVCNDALVTCNAALGTCAADLFAANETILTLQGQISVICEKFVPPNGTFKYSELNSSRVGDYRTYSYSVGSLELRPETIASPSIKNIQWTESANVNYSYDLQISTNTVSYNGPRASIGASDIIVKSPSGSIVNSINTLVTGTYTVLVNFSANLGSKYPAPDYFPIGQITVSQTAPGDLPNSDTVIGYTDYGCP